MVRCAGCQNRFNRILEARTAVNKPNPWNYVLLFVALWVFNYIAYFIAFSLVGGLNSATLGGWVGVVFLLIPVMATIGSLFLSMLVAIVIVIVSGIGKRTERSSDADETRKTS